MYEGICDALHEELDRLEKKYSTGEAHLNSQDLQDIDKISHALKCLKTYEAMKASSEYDGTSYARGRSRMTGRYISRDGYSRDGYDPYPDGYRR